MFCGCIPGPDRNGGGDCGLYAWVARAMIDASLKRREEEKKA